MEKRYQVFISSTFQDLQNARQEVSQALLRADCFPAGMELFPAADEEQFEFIKTIIDQSDYYILISAGRYGSIHPETGLSYTEMEYDYAVQTGKPIIRLLHKDPFNELPGKNIEATDVGKSKLKAFRKKLTDNSLVAFWLSDKELGLVVREGLANAIKTKPAKGWVQGNTATESVSASATNRTSFDFVPIEDQKVKLRYQKFDPDYLGFIYDDDEDQAFENTNEYQVLDGAEFAKLTLHALLHSDDFSEALALTTDQKRAGVRFRLSPTKLSQVRPILEYLEFHNAVRAVEGDKMKLSVFQASRKKAATLDQRYIYGSRWKLTEEGRRIALSCRQSQLV